MKFSKFGLLIFCLAGGVFGLETRASTSVEVASACEVSLVRDAFTDAKAKLFGVPKGAAVLQSEALKSRIAELELERSQILTEIQATKAAQKSIEEQMVAFRTKYRFSDPSFTETEK